MAETAEAVAPAQTNGTTQTPKKEVKKIRSIVVDTFTAFQKNEVLRKWDNGKAGHDDWKDYGVDIVLFVERLIQRGFTVVGVLGYEGTGKSFGMKNLEPKTNIWFNADKKVSTYKGGKEEYGTLGKPTHYMKFPENYDDVLAVVDNITEKNLWAENPVAFLLAHIEDYKSADGKMRQRLKTLGKLTNKMNIEDKFSMCYYTEVTKEGDKVKYQLRTQNGGSDTCRSLEQQHSTTLIDNNFKLILDSIDNY